MQKLVKLSALAVAMGLAAAAQADVSVPTFKGGFDVSLQANYLKASAVDNEMLPTVSGDEDSLVLTDNNLEFPSKFGFGVEVGYKIPNTGNDISFSYSQIKSDASAAEMILDDEDINFYDLGLPLTIDGMDLTRAKAVEQKIKSADLLFGQYVNVGNNLSLHLTAGLSYAKVDYNSAAVYDFAADEINYDGDDLEDVSGTLAAASSSTFKGFGPKLGLEANYHIGSGFSLVAGTNMGLLVGKTDSATAYGIDATSDEGDVDFVIAGKDSNRRVVPTIDAKLGLGYTYAVNDNYQFNVEAGYQVKEFSGAIERENLVGANTVNDITLDGPYLKLKLAAC